MALPRNPSILTWSIVFVTNSVLTLRAFNPYVQMDADSSGILRHDVLRGETPNSRSELSILIR